MRTRVLALTLVVLVVGSMFALAGDCGNPPPYQPSAAATLAGAVGVDVTSQDWENWCHQYGDPQGSGTGRWCRIDPNWCHRPKTTTVLGTAVSVPGASGGAAVGTSGAAVGASVGGGVAPHPAYTYSSCDDFCQNLRAVLDDRGNFKHIRGDKIQSNQYNSRVTLAGARYCHVEGGRWDDTQTFTCNMNPDPDMGPNEAQAVFADTVDHVRYSLPQDWQQQDATVTGSQKTVSFRPPYPAKQDVYAPVNVVVTDYPSRSIVSIWIPKKP